MYHYTDSGLDNIFLVNGYHRHTMAYGEGVSIEDMEGLHKVIGRWLIDLPKPLTGAEFRFLRHELDLSQKKLGRMMGKTELTVLRWERGRNKAVDPIADRFIRILYSEYIGNKPIKEIIERLAELDQVEHAECRLDKEKNGRWRVTDAAHAA